MEQELQQARTQPLAGMPPAERRYDREQPLKTIAVRVEEELHTQLRFIAQLTGSTITDEIRRAIENRITTAQDDPDLIARAQAARDEIEREAAARSAALAGFLGKPAVAATTTDKPAESTPKPRRSNRTANE